MLNVFPLLLSAVALAAPSRKNPTRATQVPSRQYVSSDYVLDLRVLPSDKSPPSSQYLARTLFAHEIQPNITANSTTAELSLITVGGRVYMTTVTFGGDNLTLVIDTGSSDTWAITENFTCYGSDANTPNPYPNCGFASTYYTPSANFSAVSPQRNFSVRYSDGEYLNGILGVENLIIGGLPVRQTVGVVDEGYWLGDGRSSGLMGLAFPSLESAADLGYDSVIFSLIDAGDMPPVFSLALNRYSSSNPYYGGTLSLGGLPPGTYPQSAFATTPLTMTTANIYTFYSINVDGFSIAAPSLTRRQLPFLPLPPPYTTWTETGPLNLTTSVVIDSGTTLMYLPDDLTDHIASLFNPPAVFYDDYGLWLVNCTAKPPTFGVVVSGQTFFVNPTDLMSYASAGLCIPTIQRQGSGSTVLGDAWLQSVLAVFDVGNNEISFAAREYY